MTDLLEKKEILKFKITKYGRNLSIEELLTTAGELSESHPSGTLDNGDAVVEWEIFDVDEKITYKAQLEAIQDHKTKAPF